MLVAPCDACSAGRWLYYNKLTGALPTELGLMTGLTTLYVGRYGRKDEQGGADVSFLCVSISAGAVMVLHVVGRKGKGRKANN